MFWSSPSVTRNGNCCGTSNPDKCLEFVIDIHPKTIAINFTIATVAIPPGELFYQVDSGPLTPMGSPICLSGTGPHTLTFCKPGNDTNSFTITSLSNPAVPPGADLHVNECPDFIADIAEETAEANFPHDHNERVSKDFDRLNNIKTPIPPPPSPKVQDGPCVNMDFETGDFTGWTLTRGTVTGAAPYSFAGEFPVGPGPYHVIFGGGVDPVTGIPRVDPMGGGFSARLGNGTGVGAQAARLKQTFLVDATNYMFTYSYAVVFESPLGHGLNQLPYFTIRVFDSLGNSIPCGEYSVIADATTAPEYLTTNWFGTTVLYKDWSSVFTNLSAYIGQNVTVEFTSGDCSLTGHFSYAYVDASCGVSSLTATNDIICPGDSSILSAPLGAASYLWSNGAITQTTTVFSGGVYSCTITPFQGGACDITLDITIIENPAPMANFISNTLTACLGDSIHFTDMSTIALPGVIANYRWNFGDGIVTPLSNGPIAGVPNTTGFYILPSHLYTAPGVYNVQLYVESSDGCSDSITITVTINNVPVVVAGPDQAVCEGTAVTLNGAGATFYAWDNGVVNGVPFVPVVGTLTYTVTGTDINGCINTDQVDVTVYPLPNVGAGPDQTVCFGTAVTLNGAGATFYAWDNGVVDGVPFVPVVGTLTYTVTGTDGNGCINTDHVDVTVNPLPNVVAGPDQTVCFGTAVTLNGAGATFYAWDNGIVDGVPFVPVVGTLTYTVTGTDINGCSATDIVSVLVQANPVVTAADVVICVGEGAILNGQGADYYEWSGGVEDGEVFYPTNSGLYTVTGYFLNGCFSTSTANVIVNPEPFVDFIWLNTQLSTNNSTTGFDNLSVGAVSYEWYFGDGSSYSYEFEPVHTFPFEEGAGYYVTLTGTSEFGCVSEASKYIEVAQDYSIFAPNTFTPDFNGVNDVFTPILRGFDEQSYTLLIFNRWGNLIFESHDMDIGWNGTFAGGVDPCQDGVYTWKIYAKVKNSTDSQMFIGHVSILK